MKCIFVLSLIFSSVSFGQNNPATAFLAISAAANGGMDLSKFFAAEAIHDAQNNRSRKKADIEERAKKAQDYTPCIRGLQNANSRSTEPLRFYGDSEGVLLQHINDVTRVYTPHGSIEINGASCKVDATKTVSDALIDVAKNIISSGPMVEMKSTEMVSMLKECANVDANFREYAIPVLRDKYNVTINSKDTSPNQAQPAN
jgi:hypothetical protein